MTGQTCYENLELFRLTNSYEEDFLARLNNPHPLRCGDMQGSHAYAHRDYANAYSVALTDGPLGLAVLIPSTLAVVDRAPIRMYGMEAVYVQGLRHSRIIKMWELPMRAQILIRLTLSARRQEVLTSDIA